MDPKMSFIESLKVLTLSHHLWVPGVGPGCPVLLGGDKETGGEVSDNERHALRLGIRTCAPKH